MFNPKLDPAGMEATTAAVSLFSTTGPVAFKSVNGEDGAVSSGFGSGIMFCGAAVGSAMGAGVNSICGVSGTGAAIALANGFGATLGLAAGLGSGRGFGFETGFGSSLGMGSV